MLSKWTVPGVLFAGWMIAPAVNLSSGGEAAAPAEMGNFKYEKEEVGATPRLA